MTPTPDCVLDALIDEAIPRPYRWERNWKGNLVRHYNGMILTVFELPNSPGWFKWSMGHRRKVRYSHYEYRTEAAALAALEEKLFEE